MNATQPHFCKTDLTVTHVLAALLERLEQSAVPVGAEQYRSVVQHLVNELGDVEPGAALGALLDTHPAAAELYENVNYQYAGLCRSALDASLAAITSVGLGMLVEFLCACAAIGVWVIGLFVHF